MVSGIYQWSMHRGKEIEPSPRALADLARRKALPETRDLTGILQGDPPAGRSALDQKRAKEARQEQEHADE